MLKLASRRLIMAIPLMLVVSFFIFALMSLAPGDPAARLAGETASQQQIEQIRKALKLNEPVAIRYWDWLSDVAHGNLGTSFSTREPVPRVIAERAGITASLALLAIGLTLVLGIAGGVAAALRPGGAIDHAVTVFASLAMSMPPFWLGILLLIPLAVERDWFPALGYAPLSAGVATWLSHLALPACALAMTPIAETTMQLKSALNEIMHQDYILAANAKGIPTWKIIGKHALKNAAVPVVTILGLRVSQLLGGTVAIEQVFVLNGLGSLAVSSTLIGDIPVLLGLTLFATAIVILTNLLVDISYGYFNPKVRG